MPLLSKRRQVLADKETVGGTLATLDSADADLVLVDATAGPDIEAVERNILRDSLSLVKTSVGQKAGTMSITTELAGTSSGTFAGGYPPWSRLLEGCGFRPVPVRRFTIGAITGGPFQHGEEVTVSTWSGKVMTDTHDGQTELLVFDYSGSLPTLGTITGGSSGASAVISGSSATTVEAFGWYPISEVEKLVRCTIATEDLKAGSLIEGDTSGTRAIVSRDAAVGSNVPVYFYPVRGDGFTASETCTVLLDKNPAGGTPSVSIRSTTEEQFVLWPSLSMQFIEDGQSMTIAGARGSVSFNFEVNRPVTATFNFRGSLYSTDDQAFYEGTTADAPSAPPIWQGSAVGWVENEDATYDGLADELEPCMTALQVDMGVQLSDRRCQSSTTGLEEVLGTTRAPSGSMDPEVTLEADIGWLSYLKDGKTARLRVPLGSDAGNRFTFFMPGVQLTGSSYGDRDGIATHDLAFNLTGGFHHNLAGTGDKLDTFGGDNELVIVYHLV